MMDENFRTICKTIYETKTFTVIEPLDTTESARPCVVFMNTIIITYEISLSCFYPYFRKYRADLESFDNPREILLPPLRIIVVVVVVVSS